MVLLLRVLLHVTFELAWLPKALRADAALMRVNRVTSVDVIFQLVFSDEAFRADFANHIFHVFLDVLGQNMFAQCQLTRVGFNAELAFEFEVSFVNGLLMLCQLMFVGEFLSAMAEKLFNGCVALDMFFDVAFTD